MTTNTQIFGTKTSLARLVLSLGVITLGIAQAQTTLPVRFTYSAWFACGSVNASSMVQPGNYTTLISLHNPEFRDVVIQARVTEATHLATSAAVHPIAPTRRLNGQIGSDQTTYISCDEIVTMLKGTVSFADTPLMQGYVLVDVYFAAPLSTDPGPAELDEVSTNTSAVNGQVATQSVTTVTGRKLAAGVWPN